jgi:hypothetical protein
VLFSSASLSVAFTPSIRAAAIEVMNGLQYGSAYVQHKFRIEHLTLVCDPLANEVAISGAIKMTCPLITQRASVSNPCQFQCSEVAYRSFPRGDTK